MVYGHIYAICDMRIYLYNMRIIVYYFSYPPGSLFTSMPLGVAQALLLIILLLKNAKSAYKS